MAVIEDDDCEARGSEVLRERREPRSLDAPDAPDAMGHDNGRQRRCRFGQV